MHAREYVNAAILVSRELEQLLACRTRVVAFYLLASIVRTSATLPVSGTVHACRYTHAHTQIHAHPHTHSMQYSKSLTRKNFDKFIVGFIREALRGW